MLDQIYTEIILENSRNSRNKGELDSPTMVERGHNPSCGDDLTLMVNIEKNIITDAKFIGDGCALSTASMSMMIDLIKGKDLENAKKLMEIFLKMIQGADLEHSEKALLQDSSLFETLKDMPARVKCGTLGWHCLRVILNSAE